MLDPAMGSGHFLVDATNFLARALATDEYTTAARDGDEADLTYWQRRVVEACIYGVDKNELAVELAKLSLWLVTVSGDKPLSFLDHHLRHGDSLIGAWLKDLDGPPGGGRPDRSSRPVRSGSDPDPLFDESAFTTNAFQAVGGVAMIERMLSDDIDAVHTKEQIWADIHDNALGRWRQLADLWVSAWFGNEMSAEEYADLARRIQGRGGALLNDDQAARFLAHPAATDNDYFHWELEFPEVFFDEYGRPLGEAAGFDAVVGNPPWGADFITSDKDFLSARYVTDSGEAESYLYMLDQSLGLLRNQGLVGFITPNTWLIQSRGEPLRSLIAREHGVSSILHLRKEIFKDAPDIVPVVFVASGDTPNEFVEVAIANPDVQPPEDIIEGLYWKKHVVPYVLWQGHPQRHFNIFRSVPIDNVCKKMERANIRVKDKYQVIYGIRTGNNAKYLRPEAGDNTLPCLESASEVSRYSMDWAGVHLRIDGLLSADKQRQMALPKIVVQYSRKLSMPLRIVAAVDHEGRYAPLNRFSFIIAHSDTNWDLHFLMAVESSTLMNFYHGNTFIDYDIKPTYLQQHPLADVQFGNDVEYRVSMMRELTDSYQSLDYESVEQRCSGDFVSRSSDVVHDTLAYLAQQMTTFYQDKQTLTADFWTDLEGVVADTAVFARLHEKGKWESTLAQERAAAPYVDAESRSTRTLDESLGWDEEAFKAFVRLLAGSVPRLSGLLGVYRDYAPRYKELVERIERTDWLIDQIVYQLYGLTEEEIAIVEGRA